MSVQNGDAVDAAITNAAFVSKTANSTVTGAITLNKPSGSGAMVADVQATINDTIDDLATHVADTSMHLSGGTVSIAQGGTGQTTKAAAFDALSPMNTSGDIIYGGASGTGTRLPVGTNGHFLTLSGGVPTWAAANATKQVQDIRYDTRTGHGSTNTFVPYFTNATFNTNNGTTLLNVTNSATLGFFVKAAEACVVTFSCHVMYTGTGEIFGIAKNPSSKTTAVTSLSKSEALIIADDGGRGDCATVQVTLAVNDEMYVIATSGNAGTANRWGVMIHAEKI